MLKGLEEELLKKINDLNINDDINILSTIIIPNIKLLRSFSIILFLLKNLYTNPIEKISNEYNTKSN